MPTLQCAKCGLEVRVGDGAAGATRCKRCGTTVANGAAARPAKAAAPREVAAQPSERARHFSGVDDSVASVREMSRTARRSNGRVVFAAAALAFLAGAGGVALFEWGRHSARDAMANRSRDASKGGESKGADEESQWRTRPAAAPIFAAPAAAPSVFSKPLEEPASDEASKDVSGEADADEAEGGKASTDAKATGTKSQRKGAPVEGEAAGTAAAKGEPAKVQVAATLQEVLSEVEKSVVTLRVRTAQGERVGSGFIVGADGTIATNYQLIEGAEEVIIELGSSIEVPAEGYRAIAPRRDLAILAGPASALPERPLPLETALPPKTSQVFTVGSSRGEDEGTVTSGIVSGVRQGASVDPRLDPGLKVIQTTAPASPGSSGGPLLDSQGRVVGVTGGSAEEEQSFNYAIASEHVVELLKAQARLPLLWAQLPAPRTKPQELAETPAMLPPQPVAPPASDSGGSMSDGRLAAQLAESEAKAKQGKLDRINQRIRDQQKRRDAAEAEGSRLAGDRDARQAEADGVNAEGINLRNEFDRLTLRLASLERQRIANRDNNQPTFFLSQQIFDINTERRRLDQDWKNLEARHASLMSEVAGFEGRIDAQRQIIEDVDSQIDYLTMQGQIVSIGPERFVAKLFGDYDRDKNGVLIAREVPDQYHPVLHDAAGTNKYGVSKEQLESFLVGFGDAPK